MAALAAAGVFDPSAPDALQRRELLAFLTERGCSIEEMVVAERRGRLFALAGDRTLRPGRDTYSLADVAGLLDVDPEVVRAAWRALGLVDTAEPIASDADVAAMRTVFDVQALMGTDAALGVARVIGSSLARIADAISTSVRAQVPDMYIGENGDPLVTARTYAALAEFVPRMGSMLDVIFRHHLESARMHFEATDSYGVVAEGGIRVSVGFADLSDFTSMSEQMRLDELSSMLTEFERITMDVIHSHGARLVKFIGDAVMWVAASPLVAVRVADALRSAADGYGVVGRAGITTGTVLALDGDYFGPPVNLAARLVGIADGHEILVDEATSKALLSAPVETTPFDIEPLGAQPVRGFSEPVTIARLKLAQTAITSEA